VNCLRKLIFAALCVTLVCGSVLAESSKKVGVMWIGESSMAKRVIKSFKEQMEEKAPDVQIEYKMEISGEPDALDIYERYQKEKDAVVFLRSNAIKFMLKHPPMRPAFCGACNNPVALGAMKDMNAPDGNITGVTYYIPAAKKIAVLQKVFPNLGRVGLLTEKGHPSSPIDRAETEAACKAAGIKFYQVICTSKEEVGKGARSLVDKEVDIIIIGDQSLIIHNALVVASAAGGIPVVSYAEGPIKRKHALCGFVPNDEKLGRMLADSLIDVILGGKKISDISVKVDPKPRLLINVKMMEKLGVTIPADLMKSVEKVEG
jgi:putative ABC transport system substrate-binding protein